MAEPATGGERSNLTVRILSALVLVPLAIGAAWMGGVVFLALVAVIAIAGWAEWSRITSCCGAGIVRCAPALFIVAALFAGYWGQLLWTLVATGLALAVAAGLSRGRADKSGNGQSGTPVAWAVGGVVYIVVPCLALALMRGDPLTGLAAIFLLFLCVWATDTFAYFGGRLIGGPKLWPAVSPKKTISGAVSGLVGAIAVAGVCASLLAGPGLVISLVLGGLYSIAGQFGDLFESAVKRRFGVKDSGRTIPGHGGVLDRVDGLFGAATVALMVWVLNGGAMPAAENGATAIAGLVQGILQ